MNDPNLAPAATPEADPSIIERAECLAADTAAGALAGLRDHGTLPAAVLEAIEAAAKHFTGQHLAGVHDRLATLESAVADAAGAAPVQELAGKIAAHHGTIGKVLGLLERVFPHDAAPIRDGHQ